LKINNILIIDMSDFPFSIPRNKTFTMPPYSFTKYEVSGALFAVKKGAPDDDDPDQFDGEISDLAVTIVIPNDSTDVMLSGKIIGEWGTLDPPQQRNTGLVIHRKRVLNGVTTETILRPPEDGDRGRVLSTWATNYEFENRTSSMESSTISYMDNVNAGTITYTPILVFNHASIASYDFRLNSTFNEVDSPAHEVASSLLLVQAMS
jgi:hypothetical protein